MSKEDGSLDWLCEYCGETHNTLYEGWFYTKQRLNPYTEGTVSYGLMQLRRVCGDCLEWAKNLGLKV